DVGAIALRLVLRPQHPRGPLHLDPWTDLPGLAHDRLAATAAAPRLLHHVIEERQEPRPEGEIALVHGHGEPGARGDPAPVTALEEPRLAVRPSGEHGAVLREARATARAQGPEAPRRLAEPARALRIDPVGGVRLPDGRAPEERLEGGAEGSAAERRTPERQRHAALLEPGLERAARFRGEPGGIVEDQRSEPLQIRGLFRQRRQRLDASAAVE